RPDDREAVLQAFDLLAQDLSLRTLDAPKPEADAAVLAKFCGTVRPSLLILQNYAALLNERAAAGDAASAAEVAQRLRHQLESLLNLLEAPADLSQLERQLSGVLRENTPLSADLRTSTVAVIDPSGEAPAALRSAFSDPRWSVVVYADVERALVGVHALSPRLAMVDVGRNPTSGWQAALQLKRWSRTCGVVVWFYAVDEQAGRFQLYTPIDVWVWPLNLEPTGLLAWLRDCAPSARFQLEGDQELTASLRPFLVYGGFQAVATPEPDPAITVGAVARFLESEAANHEEVPAGDQTLFVLPTAPTEAQAARLTKEFLEGAYSKEYTATSAVDAIQRRMAFLENQ
ncbi:MAG: hypothetical protein ACRDD1_19450, partial [Planctomycetia bacterium]